MKTRYWQCALSATLVTLALTLSSRAADPQDPPPSAGATNVVPPITSPAPAAVSETAAQAVQGPANAVPADGFQLPKVGLPPLLDQVVRLNQSGTDEAVLRAYIEKAAPPYQITGNEIIQLQDLGVPKTVILSLIEHSKSSSGASEPPAAAAPAVTQPEPAPMIDAAAGTAEAAADFREPLAPYGTWLEVPGYGYCWQPTVVVVNPSWRPYSDNGDWRWSDSGWYWNSYYSWGWAPFHYGRWFSHAGRGWLWCPDRIWGPAWVSWRSSATYCGWAPLPPGAYFHAGLGWSYRGARVGIDFSFGLGAAHFTFVSHSRFSERHVGAHALRGAEHTSHFRNTTVVNNYAAGANNRIVNRGVGRERIAAASSTPIRQAAAVEPARVGSRISAPNRIRPVANSVTRAGQQPSAGRATAIRPSGNVAAARSFSQPTRMANQRPLSRSIVAGGASRPIPNYSRSQASRLPAAPSRNLQIPAQRTAPARQFQSRAYSQAPAARAMAPRSFAPSAGSVQRFRGAPSMGRSMPSGGGGQSRAMGRGGNAPARSFGARR